MDDLAGVEPASSEFVDAIARKRTVIWATPGSGAERYLQMRQAEGAAFGSDDILPKSNPSKAALLEEFLHGTQHKLGIVDRLGNWAG